jgi:tetratricopeptide (TPR) repeat protein
MPLPRLHLFLILLLTHAGLDRCTAQTATTTAPQATEESERFTALLQEVQVLQVRKRYADAMVKLDEAEKLKPGNPDVYNIRGSLLLSPQMRDAEKAREQFRKALALEPAAMPPLFNIAEVDFVIGAYADAAKGFSDVLAKFPKLPLPVRHLVTFKVLICQAKQGKIEEAEKTLKENFTFMDDTPAYYFSMAAISLQKKDEKLGNDWLAKAQHIFTKPSDTSSYLDSLMESHYIDSLDIQNESSK